MANSCSSPSASSERGTHGYGSHRPRSSLSRHLCGREGGSRSRFHPSFPPVIALSYTRSFLRYQELRVLVRREVQPDAAAALSDLLLKLLPPGYVQRKTAPLRHLPYLGVLLEHDLPWQGCLQILFEELAEPGLPKHEVHVDALLARAAALVTQAFAATMGRGQGCLTLAANLARISLPNR